MGAVAGAVVGGAVEPGEVDDGPTGSLEPGLDGPVWVGRPVVGDDEAELDGGTTTEAEVVDGAEVDAGDEVEGVVDDGDV
ncbi:MAG: hypothetical protein LBL92_00165, partial [Propionibacteriaceae bacterium]|nr:hypothetical protein [Propionibacteriaceae bacterium]